MILTPNNEYAVVLDACVLIPMPLMDTLLRLAEEPSLYRPLWSDPILQEVGNCLEQKLRYTPEQVSKRLTVMREHFPEAIIPIPPNLLASLQCMPDPNDRHVLAAAIRGHANAIVTLNIKHFPEGCIREYDLVVQHPDEFLAHQFHMNPDLVLEKLDAQAAAIKKDREAVIALLRKRVQAPNFADLVAGRS
jgi:predicted nucleic acid-binding protein